MQYDGFSVGTTLRNLRKDKHVTFEQMSDETGLSVSSLKQYEQGGRKLSINSLFVLIDFFGVDANTILNVTESKAEVSIDEKLKRLDKKQRDYLRQTFLYMVDHVHDLAS